MIAAWMAYAFLISALTAGAAWLLDALLRSHRRPTRGVWFAAMAFSSSWPLWSLLEPGSSSGPLISMTGPVVALEPLTLEVGSRSIWQTLQLPLVLGWGGTTLFLIGLGLTFLIRTHRLRRGWEGGEAQGRDVLFSEDWGPAVVGILSPQIVLPRWCRSMEEDGLNLILDHEAEHLRAGDLRLLTMAGIPPVLLPWSLPLWYMWNRLRLAVEGDCDLRVLRKNPRATRTYLELLLEVGQRVPERRMAAAMLSEPERTLERRIKTMTMPFPKRPLLRAAILGSVGLVLVAVACLAPTPTAVEEEDSVATVSQPVDAAPDLAKEPVFTPYTVRPDIKNRTVVARALEANYPPLLRDAGIGGTAKVWFFLDETGAVRSVRLQESSGHQALDDAALRVGGIVEFTPAMNEDKAVPVWISLPITFSVR